MSDIETCWSIWAHHPLLLRPGTSDRDVFDQIFLWLQYAPLDSGPPFDPGPPPDLVIDAGANAGYSAAYFLSRWPGCRVLAIEPDPDNFRLCRANLAPYGARATVVNAAVWSHSRGVVLSPDRYRDGREWSRQVRDSDAPTIPSVDLAWAVPGAGRTFLKMDVEGAEAEIFSAPDLSWLDRVDALAIEIHDDTPAGPLSPRIASVMESRGFGPGEIRGELTVYRRRAI